MNRFAFASERKSHSKSPAFAVPPPPWKKNMAGMFSAVLKLVGR